MGQYLIDGKPGVDTRPRYEQARCTGCNRIVDFIEPRTMEPEARAAWKTQQPNGVSIAGSMYRSRWREGACVCPE